MQLALKENKRNEYNPLNDWKLLKEVPEFRAQQVARDDFANKSRCQVESGRYLCRNPKNTNGEGSRWLENLPGPVSESHLS